MSENPPAIAPSQPPPGIALSPYGALFDAARQRVEASLKLAATSPPLVQFASIPVMTDWRKTDSVGVMREILHEHEQGNFTRSALLVDEMLGDDRIAGTFSTRVGGLLAAPMSFRPADDRRKSLKLARILGGSDESMSDGEWRQICDDETAKTLLKWHQFIGVAVAMKAWITDTESGRWIPKLIPWHPRHLFWNWGTRHFQLATMGSNTRTADYLVDLPRTDLGERSGTWFVWGGEYSWMSGLVRSIGMKYLDRQWNERDWARYNEKHGLALIEGKVPSGEDVESSKHKFKHDLENLGSESVIITPQMPSGEPSYGVEIHEATSRSWETFQARKQALDTDIAVLVLGQNLTTEVKGGSLAAASIHEGIRIDKKREDAELFPCLRDQVLVEWAGYNFDLKKPRTITPHPEPQLEPPEDDASEADALGKLGLACKQLLEAHPEVDIESILAAHGVPMREGGGLDGQGQAVASPVGADAALVLTPTAQASIITVNEARAKLGQLPWPGEDGNLTIAEFQAKHGGDIAAAVRAEGGGVQAALTALASLAADEYIPPQTTLLKAGTRANARMRRYQDSMTERARRSAARALGPLVGKLLTAIREAEDPRDLKKRVLKLYPMAEPGELAAIFRRMNIIANLTGREEILRRL